VTAALSPTSFVGYVSTDSIPGAPQGIFDVPAIIDIDSGTITSIAHAFLGGTFEAGFIEYPRRGDRSALTAK
jgi:hypothetical protein